eukprot:CAMPEP_0171063164 /NCGR_PEP_ID=MMETSP0766_2-20121228/5484_1 /TAXON_ID=439317 /ORGANISM="Gambierdiscus australes, Strain CAWD 149" /LENGTH=156 /DNA_ID=CAMNT_0011519023 /DNA_START=7 /DNA_END=474 /DNA_ORIENTATION=-
MNSKCVDGVLRGIQVCVHTATSSKAAGENIHHPAAHTGGGREASIAVFLLVPVAQVTMSFRQVIERHRVGERRGAPSALPGCYMRTLLAGVADSLSGLQTVYHTARAQLRLFPLLPLLDVVLQQKRTQHRLQAAKKRSERTKPESSTLTILRRDEA